MKKIIICALTSLLIVTSTGCVEQISLDEEQEQKLVQYVAYSVLEHDRNYLVELETLPETESEKESEQPTDMPVEDDKETPTEDEGNNSGAEDDNSTSITTGNLADALGLTGVSFTYCGFKVCDSYPDAQGAPTFVIKALEGKKLVVLRFDVKNTTSSAVNLDISSMNLYFKGVFDNSVKTNAQVTLLPDGLNTYKDNIAAGETVSTVLVFEMKESYTEDISNITLEIKSGSEIKSVKIQ